MASKIRKMFLDIGTVPAGEENLPVLRTLFEKSQSKKKEKSERFGSRYRELTFEDYHAGTTFSGAFGRTVCLAYAVDDGKVEVLKGDEKEILTKFWGLAKDVDLFVGHNILEFDLRFLFQRSVVLKIKPTKEISFAKYRNFPIFDTHQEWTKWGRNGESLDTLAHAFGLPSPKEELDGSKVWEYFQAGKIDEICDYCKRDVEVNREVYKRMVFEGELEPKAAVQTTLPESTEDEPF